MIKEIANSITLNTEPDGTIIAEAKVSPENLKCNFAEHFCTMPNEVNENGVLKWKGGNAFYLIEGIWDKIQKSKGITKTFAQQYGMLWAKQQHTLTPLRVKRLLPEAVIPTKAHPLDVGYDVAVVHIVKENYGPGVTLYGTGLCVCPPDGYYIDLVSRSSLSKRGWFLANGIGIIDPQYRGELCVPLSKIHENAKPLEFPERVAQIVIRRLDLCDVVEVNEIGNTDRGSSGFGSSGYS